MPSACDAAGLDDIEDIINSETGDIRSVSARKNIIPRLKKNKKKDEIIGKIDKTTRYVHNNLFPFIVNQRNCVLYYNH